jgi:hypothetical protein
LIVVYLGKVGDRWLIVRTESYLVGQHGLGCCGCSSEVDLEVDLLVTRVGGRLLPMVGL